MQRPPFSRRAPHWLGALSLLAVAACGADPTSVTATVSAKVEGGAVDTKARHVFRVLARVTGFNELCSATLIAPQLMLTARHCVAPTPNSNVNCKTDRFGPAVAPSELKFSNDVEPDLWSRWFDAHSVIVSSDSDFTCGYDIAVVVLKEPVPASVATPAEPRFSPAITSGERYSAVGYGGSDANENAAEYGVRHSRANLFVECGQRNECADNSVMAQEFLGSEGACKGDSGGPALDDNGHVIGVLSRGAEGCASPIYVGVPAFESLLVSAAREANRTLGARLPVWAGGDPAPTKPNSPPEDAGRDESTADEDSDGDSASGETTLTQEGCGFGRSAGSPASWWSMLLGGVALGLRRRVVRR